MLRTPCDAGRNGKAVHIRGSVAVAAVLFSWGAGARANAPELSLWDAVEIGYQTEPGKVYSVQGSEDLKEWSLLQGPVYGTGETIEKLVSTRQRPVTYGFYRLKVETAAEGFAPRDLTGTAFQKCASAVVTVYSFEEPGKGKVKQGDVETGFTWTWLRTGANAGEATIQRETGAREVLKLEYAGENLGRVTSETTGAVSGEVFSATGTFGPAPSGQETPLPEKISGRSLVTADAEGMERLVFSRPEAGSMVLFTGGDPQAEDGRTFTCVWTSTGRSTADLTVRFSPEHHVEYELAFLSSSAGCFVRRVFTGNVFRDQDKGTFSLGAEAD